MNIIEVIELFETHLKADENLEGINIEVDPDKAMTKPNLPMVLLEAEKSITDTAAKGFIQYQVHEISMSIIESVPNKDADYKTYKTAVNALAKKVIESIHSMIRIGNDQIRITIGDFTHNEMILGSQKSTGIVITLKVKTTWN